MDLKKIESLLNKFYEGHCSIEEENELKRAFTNSEDLPDSLKSEAAYFKYLHEEKQLKFDTSKLEADFLREINSKQATVVDIQKYRKWIMGSVVAASIALFAFFYYNFNSPEKLKAQNEPENAEEAYMEVKNALMTVSMNFNEGAEDLQKISTLDKAKKSITEKPEK